MMVVIVSSIIYNTIIGNLYNQKVCIVFFRYRPFSFGGIQLSRGLAVVTLRMKFQMSPNLKGVGDIFDKF